MDIVSVVAVAAKVKGTCSLQADRRSAEVNEHGLQFTE